MVDPLPHGTQLHCADGNTYKLGKPLAFGYASIVYSASLEGSQACFVIKEAACPYDPGLVRQGVSIASTDPESQERLKRCREGARSELETGRILSTASTRAIGTWDILRVIRIESGRPVRFSAEKAAADPDAGVFSIMPSLENAGAFLSELIHRRHQEERLFTAYELALIARGILAAIGDLHNQMGYLHGDLSTNNIFFENPKNPAVSPFGEAFLLDFGSSLPVTMRGEDGEPTTEPIEKILSDPRFSSPEMHKPGPVALTRKSDIYSIGAIILDAMALLSEDWRRRSPLDSVGRSDFIRAGASPAAADAFMNFLRRCMAEELRDRFSQTEALDAANRLVELCSRKYRIMAEPTTTTYWVDHSRDDDIQRLEDALKRGVRPLFLWGEGGCGKTETAIQFLIRQREQNRRSVAFVPYAGSMRQTIKNMRFAAYHGPSAGSSNPDEEDYQWRLKMLAENNEGTILAIDNFDSEEKTLADLRAEPACQDLLRIGGISVLFTTRFRPDQHTKPLGQMKKAHLFQLFCNAAGRRPGSLTAQEKEDVFALIAQSGAHPLTVELEGALIAESDGTVSISELREMMKTGAAFDEEKLPEVELNYNRDPHQRRFREHLSRLFNLSGLNSEAEKNILRQAALLPVEGMDEALFNRGRDDEERAAYQRLKRRSWLRVRSGVVSMHPMIREVLMHNDALAPRLDHCTPFLDRMWAAYHAADAQDTALYRQLIPVYMRAHRSFSQEDPDADNAYRAASVMYCCSEQLKKAQFLAEYAAEKREERQHLASAAEAYLLLGKILLEFNDGEGAEKAIYHAYELDCFRCDAIDLDRLADEYFRLGLAKEVLRFNAFTAFCASLRVATISLYRSMPELEDDLMQHFLLEQIFVNPEDDRDVLPHLAGLWLSFDDFKNAEEIILPIDDLSEQMNADSFSPNLYLHIIEYLMEHRDSVRDMDKVSSVLSAFHNCVCYLFLLDSEEQIRCFSVLAEANRVLCGGKSCVTEFMNIGMAWGKVGMDRRKWILGDDEAHREQKNALKRYQSYSLRALNEAESKEPELRCSALAALAQATLLLSQFEQTVSDDPAEAQGLQNQAVNYALQSIEACEDLAAVPPEIETLRARFQDSGIDLPSPVKKEKAFGDLGQVFEGSDADRAWYRERMKEEAARKRREALLRYDSFKRLWSAQESAPEFSFFSALEEDEENVLEKRRKCQQRNELDKSWHEAQLALIAQDPEEMLLPYHIDYCEGKRIRRNRIRCKTPYCEEVLESTGNYSEHQIQVCSCGSTAIDGGTFGLVRFLKHPDADAYEELSEFD